MERSKRKDTPPRSRRSNINLADLRLQPLSTRYTETSKDATEPTDDSSELPFARSHSSYIQGKSAPVTPGILSRSSSRKSLGAGLRRTSIYDNDGQTTAQDVQIGAADVMKAESLSTRTGILSEMPKAKSEAALLVERSKRASKVITPGKSRQYQYQARLRAGDTTAVARVKSTPRMADEDWITRTGAAASAILQESKGQSWIVSRESSTSLVQQESTDEDDDEGYEELAAQSVNASRRRLYNDELSPVSTRASRWGSRYGSRAASRRTSRRGSVVNTGGSRTPTAMQGGLDAREDYFEDAAKAMEMEPDFVDGDDDIDSQDEASLRKLTESKSFGLGGLVDRIMNFQLFNVEEKEETTEDESDRQKETEEQARERMAAENRRKREEKEKLTSRNDPGGGDVDSSQQEGGWKDAAWLLSVASKALF